MDKNTFWEIIDKVNKKTKPNDLTEILNNTKKELMQYSLQEIAEWYNIQNVYFKAADTDNLKAAAVTINDRMSDDQFIDFRVWLISQGKNVYHSALKNADSLVNVNVAKGEADFESYSYVAERAYQSKRFLHDKVIDKICKEYFGFMPPLSTLNAVKAIVENTCFYQSLQQDIPAMKALPNFLREQENIYFDFYDFTNKCKLNHDQCLDITSELEYEIPIDYNNADFEETIPNLYAKYQQEQEFNMANMQL